MNLKFSKTDIIILIILLALSPLLKIIFNIFTIGGALIFEGIFVIFFSLFGYIWASYGYAKHSGRTWKKETVEKYREILPKLLLNSLIIFLIGVILLLVKI